MLISRIMRTNVDEKRLEHHIYASQLVSDINPEGHQGYAEAGGPRRKRKESR